jgi:hypothetical protein
MLIFTKAFVPPQIEYSVAITTRVTGNWSAASASASASASGGATTSSAAAITSASASTSPSSTHGAAAVMRAANDSSISTVEGGGDNKEGAVRIGWLGWSQKELPAVFAAADELSASHSTSTTTSNTTSNTTSVAVREEFLVFSTLGAGLARELAVKDPFRALKLQPFVTLAIKVLRAGELCSLSTPISTGLIYCAGSLVVESGLPFHIEAPFLQDISDRSLPLPLATDISGALHTVSARMSGGRITSPYLRVCISCHHSKHVHFLEACFVYT